jgi:hypothetical protein
MHGPCSHRCGRRSVRAAERSRAQAVSSEITSLLWVTGSRSPSSSIVESLCSSAMPAGDLERERPPWWLRRTRHVELLTTARMSESQPFK